MINKYFKTNKELQKEVEVLKENLRLKTEEAQGYKASCFSLLESSTAEKVIQEILKRGINWFDYQLLPKDEQRTYVNEAKYILKTRVFQNELSALVFDLTEEIATKAKSFEEVLNLRSKIATVELIKDRLTSIHLDDDDKKEPENPHSAI